LLKVLIDSIVDSDAQMQGWRVHWGPRRPKAGSPPRQVVG